MLDDSQRPNNAALVLNPHQRHEGALEGPIRFGGLPRLPEGMDWPVGRHGQDYYFLAEIDFAAMPRAVDIDGRRLELPHMPQNGSAFLFGMLAGEGLYEPKDGLRMLYTPLPVAGLPERPAPDTLQSLHDADSYHLRKEGLSDCGRILAKQTAFPQPIETEAPISPLRINMTAVDGTDLSQLKADNVNNEARIAKALSASEQPQNPTPHRIKHLPADMIKYKWRLEDRHCDWAFIFDFSKAFLLELHQMRIDHLKRMEAAGLQRWIMWYFKRFAQKDRAKVEAIGQREGKVPPRWDADAPPARDLPFDKMAQTWVALSRGKDGDVPEAMFRAFADMLQEVEDNNNLTDDDGYNVGPRNDLLDRIVRGHDRHAGNTMNCARAALDDAIERAMARREVALSAMDVDERWQNVLWDQERKAENMAASTSNFSTGAMPLQMFGRGLDIQGAVEANAENVMLLQIGGDHAGLPLDFGGDGVLQLWMAPEDLAQARFEKMMFSADFT
ncbi:DUF1963 domain-containing protein [Primorskyibacter sp. S187A]|uniref:DUF1963 domain-containing protein n=1 Tax=Primorskyibacter sp. S187A TaxID=3415130 RepID=UPI003C799360